MACRVNTDYNRHPLLYVEFGNEEHASLRDRIQPGIIAVR